MKMAKPKGRWILCFLLFVSAFGFLTLRVIRLQILSSHRLAEIAYAQQGQEIKLTPQRGTIYDSKGRALAMSLLVPSVFADPHLVENPKATAKRLAKVLSVPFSRIHSHLKKKNRRFVWIARHIDPALEAKIKDLQLPGVYVTHEGTRLYPDRELASQVLGFVGLDGKGLEGLERYYEKFLNSKEMTIRIEKDGKGRAIYSKNSVLLEPQVGADIYLTIDATIQHHLEKELFSAAKRTQAKQAMGAVMDPHTGEIFAMASYPAPNPNRWIHSDLSIWRNRFVQTVYEPGSTMKIFTLIAALEKGLIQPSDIFYTKKGSLVVNRKTIRTHHDHTWLTPRNILKHSDNIGVGRIALQLGRTDLHKYLRHFGFASKAGIDFPGEVSGLLSSPETWEEVDLVNIAFGQGIAITPVQLLAAVASIANGGYKVIPSLTQKVTFVDGKELALDRKTTKERLIQARTADLLRDWMEAVTEEEGTGTLAAMENYRVAGKTGTSQKIDEDTKTYSRTKLISSFVGFAPVSNPRLVSLIIFDEPSKGEYGGEIAAPVFRNVMQASLQYLHVAKDRELKPLMVAEKSKNNALDKLQTQFDLPKLDQGVVPDFQGLSMREVLKHSSRLGLPVILSGSGRAFSQYPEPGEKLTDGLKIKVHFSPLEQRT